MEVAICHFCEHHGPSVIFHTRLVTETDSYTSSQLSTPPAPIFCTVRKRKLIINDLNWFVSYLQACNPFGNDHPGYTSNEATSNKSTISSNRYTSDIVKNQLQQACFRSLSSEVCFIFVSSNQIRPISSSVFVSRWAHPKKGQFFSVIQALTFMSFLTRFSSKTLQQEGSRDGLVSLP